MANRLTGIRRAPSIGLRLGLTLMLIDILVHSLWLVANHMALLPMDFSFSFSRAWVAIHWPTHDLLAPLVWPYLPSHGAGWRGVIAMGVYIVGCGLHAFVIGFASGHIVQFLIRRFRTGKE